MKLFKTIILIVFAGVLFFPVNNALSSTAKDQLKATIDQILEILDDPALQGEDKAETKILSIRKLIHERFSFAKMSQLSLARHWRQRDIDEKKEFVELFGKLLEQTYRSKIEIYTDEKIVYIKEFVRKNKAQVYTKVITDSVEIPIDYRMYKSKDGLWMVYDLVIEGVSLVGNYRSQFDQFLRKDSYEELIQTLKKKI